MKRRRRNSFFGAGGAPQLGTCRSTSAPLRWAGPNLLLLHVTGKMKYLDVAALAAINTQFETIDVGDSLIHGKIEAFSCM